MALANQADDNRADGFAEGHKHAVSVGMEFGDGVIGARNAGKQ